MLGLWPYRRNLATTTKAKHSPSISLISIVVMVIPTRDSSSWNMRGKTLAGFSCVLRRTIRSIGEDEARDEAKGKKML
jgi:hypothetical protein